VFIVKSDTAKKKVIKNPAKQIRKAMPSAKHAAAKKAPAKKTAKIFKPAAKKAPSKKAAKSVKKTPFTPAEKKKSIPAAKPAVIKKAEKAPLKPEKPETAEKPGAVPLQDMSLPEGNVMQETGHRRPLIVFPK
jgi:hypothetical protein